MPGAIDYLIQINSMLFWVSKQEMSSGLKWFLGGTSDIWKPGECPRTAQSWVGLSGVPA